MKRMFRTLGVTLLILAFASAALAQNANQRVVGKKGIGFTNSDAPFGMRYWMSDAMAIDIGVGLGVDTKAVASGKVAGGIDASLIPSSIGTDETLFDFAIDVGLPFVLHSEENMIVYFRPGAGMRGDQVFTGVTLEQTGTNPPVVTDVTKDYETAFNVGLGLGGEFFLGQLGWPNLSFGGQVGLNVEILTPAGDGDTDINFWTNTTNVSIVDSGALGFHIYF